jgi:excinuclease UvrABC ATPase subunit
MTSLYALSKDFKAAELDMLDMGADSTTVADTLEAMAMPIKDKAINVMKYIKNIEGDSAAIDKEIKMMQSRKKSLDGKVTALMSYLHGHLSACDIGKITCPQFEIDLVKTPVKMIIDDENKIPKKFISFTRVSKVDTKAMKEELKKGKAKKWGHLQSGTRLRIK